MTICAFTASRVRRASVLRGMPYSPSLLLLAKPRSCDASKSCCDASKSWRSAMLVFSMHETSSRGKRLADGEANTRMDPVTSAVRPSSKRSCMRTTIRSPVGAGEPCRWGPETYALARWSPYNLKNQPEQEMHVAAVGSAFRRLGSIGSPHLAQVPYVPSDIRFRAASI
jgi:hypothetical protein